MNFENSHWQGEAISWDFAQGGYPSPRFRGKTQEGAVPGSGAGMENEKSHGDKRAG